MFNFFKKSDDSIKVIDRIWMTESAKLNGLLTFAKAESKLMIVCWFPDTAEKLTEAFNQSGYPSAPVYLVRDLHAAMVRLHNVVFAEHYPTRHKEQEVFKSWQLKQAVVYSSLEDPLFRQFGGARVMEMMRKLGMDDSSQIEHSLVSKSIRNAQEKIEKKVTLEQPATSAAEWMERNYQ